jgi:hypothetical protein
MNVIRLTAEEIASGYDRVKWAEGLILLLAPDHEGRNSWLINYGVSEEAERLRAMWMITNPERSLSDDSEEH